MTLNICLRRLHKLQWPSKEYMTKMKQTVQTAKFYTKKVYLSLGKNKGWQWYNNKFNWLTLWKCSTGIKIHSLAENSICLTVSGFSPGQAWSQTHFEKKLKNVIFKLVPGQWFRKYWSQGITIKAKQLNIFRRKGEHRHPILRQVFFKLSGLQNSR